MFGEMLKPTEGGGYLTALGNLMKTVFGPLLQASCHRAKEAAGSTTPCGLSPTMDGWRVAFDNFVEHYKCT